MAPWPRPLQLGLFCAALIMITEVLPLDIFLVRSPCWTQGTWAVGMSGSCPSLCTGHTEDGARAQGLVCLAPARSQASGALPVAPGRALLAGEGAGGQVQGVEGRGAGVWTPQPTCCNILSYTLASTGASPFVCSRNCYYPSYIPISCVETELIIVQKLKFK